MALVNMLDLSTAHVEVTSETEMRPRWRHGSVTREPVPDFGRLEVWSREHGWVVVVSTNTHDCPKWLLPIMKYAFKCGCLYVNFDAAADIDEQFQTYDW